MTTSTSPDLSTIGVGLRQWIATLLGLELAAVQWEDEPRTMIVGTSVTINMLAERTLGQDEHQREYDAAAPAGAEIVRTVGGPRRLTLSVKVEGYDQRLASGVFFATSAAASKMRGGDSLAALRELGFALYDVSGPVNVPRENGGRTYPRAVLDVRLGYTRVETLSPTTWIEKVKLRTRLRDADGTELPSPPNGELTIEATT